MLLIWLVNFERKEYLSIFAPDKRQKYGRYGEGISLLMIMKRVYLDWGVVSNLKRDEYAELRNLLLSNKGRLFFVYSPAHFEDLTLPFCQLAESNEGINDGLQ